MKKWYQSKTIGINAAAIGAVAAIAEVTPPEIVQHIQPGWVTVALAVINIAVRIFFTKSPIA